MLRLLTTFYNRHASLERDADILKKIDTDLETVLGCDDDYMFNCRKMLHLQMQEIYDHPSSTRGTADTLPYFWLHALRDMRTIAKTNYFKKDTAQYDFTMLIMKLRAKIERLKADHPGRKELIGRLEVLLTLIHTRAERVLINATRFRMKWAIIIILFSIAVGVGITGYLYKKEVATIYKKWFAQKSDQAPPSVLTPLVQVPEGEASQPRRRSESSVAESPLAIDSVGSSNGETPASTPGSTTPVQPAGTPASLPGSAPPVPQSPLAIDSVSPRMHEQEHQLRRQPQRHRCNQQEHHHNQIPDGWRGLLLTLIQGNPLRASWKVICFIVLRKLYISRKSAFRTV